MTSSTRLSWTGTLALILVAVAVGCASSPPPPPPPVDYGPTEAAVRARVGELERQGAAAFLPGDFAALTERVARTDGAEWVALEQELPAFEQRLADESAARAAQARADTAAVTATADSWQAAAGWDCRWAVASWNVAGAARGEALAALGRIEAEPAASLAAIAAAGRAASALATTVLEGVRCGVVAVAPDTIPQLLAAAAVVLADGHGGDAAGLLAAVVELDPTSAAGLEAKAALAWLTPEIQARTRAAVDEAVTACDRDLAKHRLAVLGEMLAVVAEHAPEQVDPAIGGERPRLEEAIRAMTASCGLEPDHEELDAALGRELDGLLKAGRLAAAEGKVAAFSSPELRAQYQRRIAVEKARVAVRDALAAGDLDLAVARCAEAAAIDRGVPAATCAEAFLARARQALEARALAQATADAREAVRLQGSKATKGAAADIFAEVGRQATAKGDGKAAVGALTAALELSDDAVTHAALAAALAGEGDYAAAGRHLETALARGATVDLATRLSIQLVGAVLSGDPAAMERAVQAVQGEGGSGGKTGDLTVHALRIAAYLDLGPRAAAAAGAGGSIRTGLGCMVFAGTSRGDAGGAVTAAIATARSSGIGFSPDLRYCAVIDRSSGAAAVFDARAGNLGRTVQRSGVPSDVALAGAVGAVDVACSALPFLAQEAAVALAAGGGREAVQQRLDGLATSLLGRTFAFIGVADAMGRTVSWAAASGGPSTAGATPARVPTPGSVEVVAATVGGGSFLEVAAPIDDHGSLRGVLRAGIEADAARAGRLSCGG